MASITKFLKSPKKYSAKKFSSGIKTVKEQPLTLAATVLATLSEIAQDNDNYNKGLGGARGPLSSLLRGGAQLTQGWQSAKALTKKNARLHAISEIVNAPGLKNKETGQLNPGGMNTKDKINKLIAAGDLKTATSLLNVYGVKKSLKHKEREFGETVRKNNATIENQNRNYELSKNNQSFDQGHKVATFKKSVEDTVWERNHTTGRDNINDTHWESGQHDKNQRALVNAIGNILKKGGTPEQLLALIKNNSLATGIQVKKKVPFITNQSIKVVEPKFIEKPTQTANAFQKFLDAVKDI